MRHLKYFLSSLSLIAITSCVKTTFLTNGHTHVATNPKVYKNRKYFDSSILNKIDSTVIYEQFDNQYYDALEKQKPVLARLNHTNPDRIYGVYRFYGNECFSLFHLDRRDTILTKEMFDPKINGWRGILYSKKNLTQGDMITQTGELSIMIGKQTSYFQFYGDTLLVTKKGGSNSSYATDIYIKRKISADLLRHNADW